MCTVLKVFYIVLNFLFQNLQEDIMVSQDSPTSKRCAEERDHLEPKSKKNRLSLKRNKDKKENVQTGQGNLTSPPNSPFVVEQSEENYFTLEIFRSKSFHKSEAAKEITYTAKLKHPAPNRFITDLAPHLYALFQTLIDEMIEQYGV